MAIAEDQTRANTIKTQLVLTAPPTIIITRSKQFQFILFNLFIGKRSSDSFQVPAN